MFLLVPDILKSGMFGISSGSLPKNLTCCFLCYLKVTYSESSIEIRNPLIIFWVILYTVPYFGKLCDIRVLVNSQFTLLEDYVFHFVRFFRSNAIEYHANY